MATTAAVTDCENSAVCRGLQDHLQPQRRWLGVSHVLGSLPFGAEQQGASKQGSKDTLVTGFLQPALGPVFPAWPGSDSPRLTVGSGTEGKEPGQLCVVVTC